LCEGEWIKPRGVTGGKDNDFHFWVSNKLGAALMATA
jgi:hypothetical protein